MNETIEEKGQIPKEAAEIMQNVYKVKKRYRLTLEEWDECDGQKVWKEQPWTVECASLKLTGEDKEALLSMMCEKLIALAVPTSIRWPKEGKSYERRQNEQKIHNRA